MRSTTSSGTWSCAAWTNFQFIWPAIAIGLHTFFMPSILSSISCGLMFHNLVHQPWQSCITDHGIASWCSVFSSTPLDDRLDNLEWVSENGIDLGWNFTHEHLENRSVDPWGVRVFAWTQAIGNEVKGQKDEGTCLCESTIVMSLA